jgi:serine phosphatase RsbU (regulator of sigma subunit)
LASGAVEPLWVLGRAMGALIASESAGKELAELAGAAAPMFELATGFTDVFERGRRREQPSAAAEMQLELLPPRMARVARGSIVASVLPAYDVGGDWFDHADSPEGVWFAIADAMGKGTRAAAIG